MKNFFRLAKSVREYKKYVFLTPLFIIFEVAIEIYIPMLTARLIDRGIEAGGGNMSEIVKYGIILIVSAVVMLAFGALAGRTCSLAGTGFAKNLRHDIYYNIQNFSFSNIDKFSTSSLVTRMTTDVNNMQNAMMLIVRTAIRAPFMLIFAFFASWNISKNISLVFLVCIPVLAVGLFVIVRAAYPIFTRVFKTYDKLNGVVSENLRGIRVVKSYVREDHEKGKFNKVSDTIFSDFVKAEKTVAFNMPLMQLCVYTCMLLIAWIGAKAIVASGNIEANGLTTGQLTSLISYATQILMSLMMLSMILVQITLSRASMERIVEVLDEKSDIVNCENPVYEVPNGSICFKNVNFAYYKNADKLCLENINLDIKSGETIGILGVTGSSKSTLVQLIPRLYDVTAGEVEVGGTDVRDYDIKTLRDSVAMVLQKNVLFSGTIKENLRWGNENATDEEIRHACILSCADEFIQGFTDGYDTYIEQEGSNVSGGQKQRLCIARALLKKPKILILDDSTSAVDTKTDARIRRALRDEIPDTTKIIIAQRVSSVMDADRIILIDDGKIEECDSHDELMKRSETYREVYTSQMKGSEN